MRRDLKKNLFMGIMNKIDDQTNQVEVNEEDML